MDGAEVVNRRLGIFGGSRSFRTAMNHQFEMERHRLSLTCYGVDPPDVPECSCWYALNGDLEKRDPDCPTHGRKT